MICKHLASECGSVSQGNMKSQSAEFHWLLQALCIHPLIGAENWVDVHGSLKDFDLEMWPPMLIAFSLNQTQGIAETLKNLVGLPDYSNYFCPKDITTFCNFSDADPLEVQSI